MFVIALKIHCHSLVISFHVFPNICYNDLIFFIYVTLTKMAHCCEIFVSAIVLKCFNLEHKAIFNLIYNLIVHLCLPHLL